MKYQVDAGLMFYQAAEHAIELAKKHKETVEFEFNGILILAYSTSDIKDLCLIYDLKHQIRRLKEGYND